MSLEFFLKIIAIAEFVIILVFIFMRRPLSPRSSWEPSSVDNWRFFWKSLGIVGLIATPVLGVVLYLGINSNVSIAPASFLEKEHKQYGICRSSWPLDGLGKPDSEFIKLEVTLAGKDIGFREFEWNNLEYASRPGCFRANPDGTHTMTNYMSRYPADSVASFYTTIRSSANDNTFSLNMKVTDMHGRVIGKFPETGDAFKGTIPFIKYPATVSQNVLLTR